MMVAYCSFILILFNLSVLQSIKPLLTGVFYEIYEDVAYWNTPEWTAEFQSMKAINISFVTIRSVYTAWYPDYTVTYNKNATNCSFGVFTSFYPSKLNCTIPSPNTNTIAMILSVAKQFDIKIHLGLVFPRTYDKTDVNWWNEYASVSMNVFDELYGLYQDYINNNILIGFYNVMEVANQKSSVNYWDYMMYNFTKPVSEHIKNVNKDLLVWASPYYRHNDNNHNDFLSPEEYANLWNELFVNIPTFDLIAPQDGVGTGNNSAANYEPVKEYLYALVNVSMINNRQIWSNAELFTGAAGTSANCTNRRPTNIDRYKQQLSVESAMNISNLICWEYHSYLSPYSGPCSWNWMAHQLYQNYTQYFYNITFPSD